MYITNRMWESFVDFLNRVFGSSYIKKERYPKNDNNPAENNFRICRRCGERVLVIKAVNSSLMSSKRSCGCWLKHSRLGILGDGKHSYVVPRLYDFVLWRSIFFVLFVAGIVMPLYLEWHGFGNVFVPLDTDVMKYYTAGIDVAQKSSYSFLSFVWYFIAPLFVAGSVIQFVSSGFKTSLKQFVLLIVAILVLIVGVFLSPSHFENIDGEMVEEEHLPFWLEEKAVVEFDLLIKESPHEAFLFARSVVDSGRNIRWRNWQNRIVNALVLVVEKDISKLRQYEEYLQESEGFNALYLKFLQHSKYELKKHCESDPWNVVSAVGQMQESVARLCLALE